MKRYLYWIAVPVLFVLYIAVVVAAETPKSPPAEPVAAEKSAPPMASPTTAAHPTPTPVGPTQPAAARESTSPSILSFWEIEIVDEIGEMAHSPSLALDAAGQPHIAYTRADDGLSPGLHYARFDGTAWLTETVDVLGKSQWHSVALAIDEAGHLHISYSTSNYDLRYAYHDGTQWYIETLDSGLGTNGGNTSLSVDPAGHPHIAYNDFTNSALKYAYHDGTIWHLTTVDNDGSAGSYNSLILDSSGRPHISYYVWGPYYDLRYAYYDGTTWQIETVDSSGDVGHHTSLRLDSAGRPHIAYFDADSRTVNYAYHNGTAWQIQAVVGDGLFTSLVIDNADRPHIACWAGNNLQYAAYDGSIWQLETVDQSENPGWDISLALDGDGRPHLAYLRSSSGDLAYAWSPPACTPIRDVGFDWTPFTPPAGARVSFTGSAAGTVPLTFTWDWGDGYTTTGSTPQHVYTSAGTYIVILQVTNPCSIAVQQHTLTVEPGLQWFTETLDSTGGRYTSLALDSAGYPHIGYRSAAGLKYAHDNGTGWQIELVDPGDVMHTSLALDAAGRPHIAYYDYVGQTVRYACYDGASWQIDTVATGVTVGYTSLALDNAGRPHISYTAGTGPYFPLYYAHHDGSRWVVAPWTGAAQGTSASPPASEWWPPPPPTVPWPFPTPVPTQPPIYHDHSSLALDTADQPHISYRCSTYYASDLLYDGETVDAGGLLGEFNSLALDTADQPHISYVDTGLLRLKYAFRSAGIWHIETVDSGSNYSQLTSLALDADGYPHISYYDATNGDLMYTYQDSAGWYLMPVDVTGTVGACTSLAMGGTDQLHISYYDVTNDALKYAYTACTPLSGVTIQGPTTLPAGITGLYTASFTPTDATSVHLKWNNDTVGPTTTYSWPVPGVFVPSVVARNGCSTAADNITVTVFCQSPTGVTIQGPHTLVPNLVGTYRAEVQPITASMPLTFTWNNGILTKSCAFGENAVKFGLFGGTTICRASTGNQDTISSTQTPEKAKKTKLHGSSAAYSWTVPGVYTPSVVVENACGQAANGFTVQVLSEWPYHFYLPIVPAAYKSQP